jgi:hypothetical protein
MCTFSPRVKARMRLQAAISLLRLARVQEYREVITQNANFLSLALVAQDPLFQIRVQFVGTLLKLLVARQLPPRFNTIIFITAHDPDLEVPNMVRGLLFLWASYIMVSTYRSRATSCPCPRPFRHVCSIHIISPRPLT